MNAIGVFLEPNEPVELALKRFKKKIEKHRVLEDWRAHARYQKPSTRRRKKALAARKSAIKRLRKSLNVISDRELRGA